jgi:hypothetical protein
LSNYTKVLARFWTGETGRALRGDAPAQLVAAYVITSPHSNMLGFYYLPISYIANDTGIPIEGASKALQRIIDGGFCRYDEQAEVIWVTEMAKYQVGESLELKDKRVISIRREYASLPNNRFLQEFFDQYGKAFHLASARSFKAPSHGASHTPSKPAAVAVTASRAASATTAAEGKTERFALPDWIPPEPWAGWLEMRTRKKTPNTTRALKLAVSTLDGLRQAGQDLTLVIDQSTKRGWTDFFPFKGNGPTQGADAQRVVREQAARELFGGEHEAR